MGSIQVKSELPDRNKFNILDYGYCIVWKTKSDSVEFMQEYPILVQSQQRLKAFQGVWPIRTNHSIFVNVYYFSHVQSNNFCGQLARGSVFTQRIPYRLSEFSNITYNQILGILKVCLEGYKVLHENYGLFLIRSTMIGFTQNFKIKIWFHTDISQPEPQNPNCKNLQQMLISILNAIQSSSQVLNYQFPRFSQFIVQTNYIYISKDFNLLIKGLQDYSKRIKIPIPQSTISLKSFIKQPQGWQKFKANTMYPKLIKTQTQINSQENIENNIQSLNISSNVFLKRKSLQTVDQMAATVKKSWNLKNQYFQANDRVFPINMLKESDKIKFSNLKITNDFSYDTNQRIKLQQNAQKERQQNLRNYRSSQKIKENQRKFQGNQTPINISRFHSPSSRPVHMRAASSQYFGQNFLNLKQFSNQSNLNNMKIEKSSTNSYEVLTATRNRQKSTDSSISLIQDLQVNGNNIFNSLKSPRIYGNR